MPLCVSYLFLLVLDVHKKAGGSGGRSPPDVNTTALISAPSYKNLFPRHCLGITFCRVKSYAAIASRPSRFKSLILETLNVIALSSPFCDSVVFASNVLAIERLCVLADQYRNSFRLSLGFPKSNHYFSEMKFALVAVSSSSETNLD